MYILINEKLLFWHKPCNNGSKSQLFQVQLACKKYLRNCSETWSLPRQTGGLKEVYTISDSLFVISFNQWWREMLCNPRGIYFEFKHELLDGFLSFITMMGLYIHRNGLLLYLTDILFQSQLNCTCLLCTTSPLLEGGPLI